MKEWLVYLPLALPLAVLLGYLGYLAWKSWKRLDELELKDRFAARNDFVKTAAQILGGAFFLITIYFTYQNLEVSQKNLVATQEKNVTDLYTKAIEQLGNKEKLEVRLGGIYALERIARDSKKDHWPIMEILTGYVRRNSPWGPPAGAINKQPGDKSIFPPPSLFPSKPDPDIQAILTVIGRRTIAFEKADQVLEIPVTNLRLADLKEAHLERAMLWNAHLEGANLSKAHLEGAILAGAHLKRAILEETKLKGADLQYADLQLVRGLKAEQLRQARNWVLAFLPEEILGNMGLPKDHNQKLLPQLDISSYNLRGIDLRGANLWGIKGLTQKQLDSAIIDETTILPDYLKKPQPEKPESK